MEIRQISGNTYTIEIPSSSIGLYRFADHHCLLIDSGANPNQGQELLQRLEDHNLTVYAIFNTHSHADHCGGNHYIQTHSHCRIFASAIEAAFIQQPILNSYALYGAYPLKLLQSKSLIPQASRISDTIGAGCVQIKGQDFEILDLGGHTLGHLGIRTPDGVLFAGDSLIFPAILSTNPCLYLADPLRQLTTIQKLQSDKTSFLHLSHGGIAEDIPALIDTNYAMMLHILITLKNIIHTPRTQEEIIHEFIVRQGLQVNRHHYFRLSASISAFLAYLCNTGQAAVCMHSHSLQYTAKSQAVKTPRENLPNWPTGPDIP